MTAVATRSPDSTVSAANTQNASARRSLRRRGVEIDRFITASTQMTIVRNVLMGKEIGRAHV